MDGTLQSWEMFAGLDEDPKPIYVYYFDPLYDDSKTMPGADQWNPCKNDFYGATFDNGDRLTGIYSPQIFEVTVDYTGSFRIAYYFLEEAISCREQNYNLFVNSELKASGTVDTFGSDKFAYFNINGLADTPTIKLKS